MRGMRGVIGGVAAGSVLGMAAMAGLMMGVPRMGGNWKRKLRRQGAKMLQNFL